MPTILALRLIFGAIFTTMLAVTVWASLQENLFQIPPTVTGDPWFQAGLYDAYFGFLTFYCWLWYKSPTWYARLIWAVLIICLGNTAMAGYMLWQLFRLPLDAHPAQLLLRPEDVARWLGHQPDDTLKT